TGTGFTIGNDPETNVTVSLGTINYYWFAFGAASSAPGPLGFRLRDEQYTRIQARCSDRLVSFGTDTTPQQISVENSAGVWSSPSSVGGITSADPRVYPLTDKLWFATNDNDGDNAWGWGAGARSKDGGATWSATPDPGLNGGGIYQVTRDAGG